MQQLIEFIKQKLRPPPPPPPKTDMARPTVADYEKIKAAEREIADRRVEHIIKKLEYLQANNPYSPRFLGDDIIFQNRHRFVFGRKRKPPNLGGIRDQITQAAEQNRLTDCRKRLNNLIKRNPYVADLRALKGIQLYNDTLNSGLDRKKLDVLRTAVTETAVALHNDGISIFNATWFIKIYLRFLEILQRRLSNEYNSFITNNHWQVRQATDELNRILLQVAAMLGIKKHLSGLTMLNSKMKGSAFTYENISNEDIAEASLIMAKGDSGKVATGKSANYVVWVAITLSSLFARVPILQHLVSKTMENIPDISRELTLQKEMVMTATKVTEYQLAMAEGDINKIETTADKLYKRSRSLINKHLQEVVTLRKSYEVDPFLKIAWITQETNGIFEVPLYKQMLAESLRLINRVVENPGEVKGSSELATQLQRNIQEIMLGYGLSPFEVLNQV